MASSQGIFCPYYAGAMVPSICLAGFAPSYLANNGKIQGECKTCSGIPAVTLNGWSKANSTCCTSASFASIVNPQMGQFLGCTAGYSVGRNERCEVCSSGTFSTGGNETKCIDCAVTLLSPGFGDCSRSTGNITECIGPGFYATPEQKCDVCPQGTYSMDSHSCKKCRGSGFCDPANGDSTSQEILCPPGSVLLGSKCVLCPVDTYSFISSNSTECDSICAPHSKCFTSGGIKSCDSNATFNRKSGTCDLNSESTGIIPTLTAIQIIPSATSTTAALLVKVSASAALKLGTVFNNFIGEVYGVIVLIKAKTQ